MDYIRQLSLFPGSNQLNLFLDYDPKEPNYLKVDYQDIDMNHLNFCPTLGGFIEVDDDTEIDDDAVENNEHLIMLEKLEWGETNIEYALEDKPFEFYKGYEIRLIIPNGGIVGASIISPNYSHAWQFNSELEEANTDLFHDKSWHLKVCQFIIDRHLLG